MMLSKARFLLTCKRFLVYTFLILFAFVCIVPFYMTIINCTRSTGQIRSGFSILPGTYLVRNFINLVSMQPVFRIFLNSAFISVAVTFLTSYFSALAAYGFTVYQFRGKSTLYSVFVVAVIMIPQQLGLVGFYTLCDRLNMLNTFWPLILPAIASPLAVFFLRQYMTQVISQSVIQAGRIDGATELGIFHRIILPFVMPGVATNAIFAFIGSWNNYLYALMIISSDEKKTLPIMIAELNAGNWRSDYGVIYLGIAISVVPILIIYSILSKRVMESVAIGGTKE